MNRLESGAGNDVPRSPNREYRAPKRSCPVISIETCSQVEKKCSSDSDEKSEKNTRKDNHSSNLLTILGGFRRSKSLSTKRGKSIGVVKNGDVIKDRKSDGLHLTAATTRRSKSFSDLGSGEKKQNKSTAKVTKQGSSFENNKQKSFLSVIHCLRRSKSSSEVNGDGAEIRQRLEDDRSGDEAGSEDSTVRMYHHHHHSARDNSSTSSCLSSSTSADESDAAIISSLSTGEGREGRWKRTLSDSNVAALLAHGVLELTRPLGISPTRHPPPPLVVQAPPSSEDEDAGELCVLVDASDGSKLSINEERERRKSNEDCDKSDDDDLWCQDDMDMGSDGRSLSAESADAASAQSVNLDAISQTVSLDLDLVSRTGSLDIADDTHQPLDSRGANLRQLAPCILVPAFISVG